MAMFHFLVSKSLETDLSIPHSEGLSDLQCLVSSLEHGNLFRVLKIYRYIDFAYRAYGGAIHNKVFEGLQELDISLG